MNLRTIDLNLLVVFDAIFRDRSISKAAQRLHLSQPTVSNALGRLRERLGDPLFERSAQGMIPTPRAQGMAEPVRQALALLEVGLRESVDFDFAQADREFVIAVEDYGETVVLPRFIDWLSTASPGIRIRIRPERATQLHMDLNEGRVDLTLNYFPLEDPAMVNTCVLTESLITLARRDHPHIAEKLTLDKFLSLRHVVLAHDFNSRPMIDLALAKRGLARNISINVPHFLSMPVLVQNSDLICSMPRRMGQLYMDNFKLKSYDVPLRIPRFPIYLSWHSRTDKDVGHRWFRERLMDFCRLL